MSIKEDIEIATYTKIAQSKYVYPQDKVFILIIKFNR